MRILVILLSLHLFVVSLLPGGDAHELCELPDLWAHQQQNHAADGFWAFFYDHYLGAHKDGAEHQALPYHHVHPSAAQLADVPPYPLAWEPSPLSARKDVVWAMQRQTDASIAVARAWWQPPRA
jgi:hypothetical protein